MATLNRDRFDLLARELAVGKTVEQAMLAAGYAPETARQGRVQHDGRSVSPNNHPEVAALLAELRADARKRSIVTIGDIVAKLEDAFEFAKANRNPAAMVQAALAQARVLGLIAPRKQLAIKPIDQMNENELKMLIGEDDAGVY